MQLLRSPFWVSVSQWRSPKKSVSVPVVKDVSIPSLAAKAVRSPLDHQVPVRQHVRRQPYGPKRSLRKDVIIPQHFRGPNVAEPAVAADGYGAHVPSEGCGAGQGLCGLARRGWRTQGTADVSDLRRDLARPRDGPVQRRITSDSKQWATLNHRTSLEDGDGRESSTYGRGVRHRCCVRASGRNEDRRSCARCPPDRCAITSVNRWRRAVARECPASFSIQSQLDRRQRHCNGRCHHRKRCRRCPGLEV